MPFRDVSATLKELRERQAEGAKMVVYADDGEKFSALAFKLMTDPFVGQLTFVRVYSGVLSKGDTVYNPVKGKKERIGRIVQMHANNREEIEEIRAGDIAACVGLKEVTTGETLCDPDSVVTLERMVFPEPVIAQAVEPKTKADQEKMGIALQRLAAEDPSFRVKTDEESGQTIIAGMGELHLEIIVDRLKREFSVEAMVGKPQVAYKETLTRPADGEMKYAKQTGGRGQYGHAKIHVYPGEPGTGYIFENEVVGGTIPKEFIKPIDEGIKEALTRGVLAGYPIDDVRIVLYDGSYHDVDSSEMAFRICGQSAMREILRDTQAEREGLDTTRAAGQIGVRSGERLPDAVRAAPKLEWDSSATFGCKPKRCTPSAASSAKMR